MFGGKPQNIFPPPPPQGGCVLLLPLSQSVSQSISWYMTLVLFLKQRQAEEPNTFNVLGTDVSSYVRGNWTLTGNTHTGSAVPLKFASSHRLSLCVCVRIPLVQFVRRRRRSGKTDGRSERVWTMSEWSVRWPVFSSSSVKLNWNWTRSTAMVRLRAALALGTWVWGVNALTLFKVFQSFLSFYFFHSI